MKEISRITGDIALPRRSYLIQKKEVVNQTFQASLAFGCHMVCESAPRTSSLRICGLASDVSIGLKSASGNGLESSRSALNPTPAGLILGAELIERPKVGLELVACEIFRDVTGQDLRQNSSILSNSGKQTKMTAEAKCN